MTQNEVSIIKNAVLDATEAYVDARLDVLNFVKTQIGVVLSSTETGHKYYHTVKCNATQQKPNGVIYNNVLSVGNIEFPANSVVFLIAPNAQFTNQFILGKLDDTPCNIVGGSIDIGNGKFTVDKNGNVICKNINAQGGHIAGFTIGGDALTVGDARISPYIMGCGYASNGIVNIVGNDNVDEYGRFGYVQISNSGGIEEGVMKCRDGIRIYGNGVVKKFNTAGNETARRSLFDIPVPD